MQGGGFVSPRTNCDLHCGIESPYGTCHRTSRHHGPCATFIGGRGFWFAWTNEEPLGYGHFRHGRFARTR